MARTTANGIQIEYETFGDPANPTILLVMGLAQQLTSWHTEFCEVLAGRSFHVVRFDNRDAGLSTWFEDAGTPSVYEAMASGRAPNPPYTLDDMADDGIGLLDQLDVETAHVVGVSMGGMIAQTMAINHGDRIASLTSVMSHTGNPESPPGEPRAIQALLAPPADPPTEENVIERGLWIRDALASPDYPTSIEQQTAWLRRDFRRAYSHTGAARQLYAILAHGDRREGLRELDIPTVVLHGANDPLIRVECGEDTAETIPGAKLRIVPGMGHDFPLQLIDTFADAVHEATRM